jgi:hypothetical protein
MLHSLRPALVSSVVPFCLPALTHTIDVADRADFCVGYFNLRG